jgi:hypothetical protein
MFGSHPAILSGSSIGSGGSQRRSHPASTFGQFFACKRFLDQLNTPYLVIPGNHDIPLYHLWNRLFTPFTRYQLFFGELEPVLETEHFYLIGVNSIRRRYHTKGIYHLSRFKGLT